MAALLRGPTVRGAPPPSQSESSSRPTDHRQTSYFSKSIQLWCFLLLQWWQLWPPLRSHAETKRQGQCAKIRAVVAPSPRLLVRLVGVAPFSFPTSRRSISDKKLRGFWDFTYQRWHRPGANSRQRSQVEDRITSAFSVLGSQARAGRMRAQPWLMTRKRETTVRELDVKHSTSVEYCSQ